MAKNPLLQAAKSLQASSAVRWLSCLTSSLTFLGLMSGVVIFLILRFFRFKQILDFVKSLLGWKTRSGSLSA